MMSYEEQKPIELVLRARDQRITSTLLERGIGIPVIIRSLSPVRSIKFNSCIPIGVQIEPPTKSTIEDQPENEG